MKFGILVDLSYLINCVTFGDDRLVTNRLRFGVW